MDTERVFDESIELADNAMLKVRPELFYEWNFEKNDELGLDVHKETKGTRKVAWWNCPKCKTPYDMPIVSRVPSPRRKESNCPYCAGKRINHTNSLAALYPELAEEWHPTKNGELTPHQIAPHSDTVVWWLSKKCGHEWDVIPTVRTAMGCGCPYCAKSNARVLKGFNDMWTTNPKLASLLADPEDGYKYMQRTTKKLDWICPKCDSAVRNKKGDLVQSFGLACPSCSDGVSYPEKFMFHFLQQADIDFMTQESFSWSDGKAYDFFLPEYNWIIESHGKQHYEENGFHTLNRSFEEEQENDRHKKWMAQENGIKRYTVINGSLSDADFIRDSIQTSELYTFSLGVDFDIVAEKAEKSKVIESWELWNSGMYSTQKIAEVLKSNRATIRAYLKRGQLIGKCDYTPEIARRSGRLSTPVIQLSLDGEFIKKWDSVTNAGIGVNIHESGITKTCRGRQKTAGGSKWMYAEDYYKEAD